ncbi:glycogen synthase GlgA [Vibrio sp.]|uniref:Glycogen synthase n=1 Tax=Vibrio viridaestus TaxID=2487322 RepID=A0A3N9TDM7_9VIBR|nr:glycogen synthase GlgA [Vibrio viridaestus]MDC0609476.1 glycogen synthase GlgA [Vibrio sp.]RQW61954.1 glycogen synthase GlgA [Vibrio viridaestus]
MEQIDIWFTVSEVQGIVKTGGLADVAKALPMALKAQGMSVKVVMPGYRSVPGKDGCPVILDTELAYWPHTRYQIRKAEFNGIEVFLVDNDEYFNRPELYSEHNRAYADNGDRFAFFSAATLDCLPKLGFKPDIIHANDWHTGLVPFLLKTRYAQDDYFGKMKSAITIHNAMFKGIFSFNELELIPELHVSGMEHLHYGYGYISMLRAGIAYADKVNAVSPNYAKELLTPLGSHGLVDDFVRRAKDLHGILNGCDYSEWSPVTDEYIPQHYEGNLDSMIKGKAINKAALQEAFHLPHKEVPVFGMVCRLTHQKGFHYLLPILNDFLKNDVQIAIVGTGEPEMANQLHHIASRFPDKCAFLEAYSNEFAHLVEAGSDFFLMPSEFEACGLNQIYSMAYGTLPIVREVGGLKDTVIDYDKNPDQATGFSFVEPSAQALLITMQRALILYLQSKNVFNEIQLRAMSKNFSWDDAATEYIKMYHEALI